MKTICQRCPPPLLLLLALTPPASADGGTLRLSQTHHGLHIAVFTSPTPLRAGTVDVSVLLQDAKNKQVVLDGAILVRATQGDRSVSGPAKAELATNKLMRAAHLELLDAGVWHIAVEIKRDEKPIEVGFDVELAGPPPAWLDLVLWLSWPVVVVGVFVIHRMIVRKRLRSKTPAPSSPDAP